jgi:hypothetical protein
MEGYPRLADCRSADVRPAELIDWRASSHHDSGWRSARRLGSQERAGSGLPLVLRVQQPSVADHYPGVSALMALLEHAVLDLLQGRRTDGSNPIY